MRTVYLTFLLEKERQEYMNRKFSMACKLQFVFKLRMAGLYGKPLHTLPNREARLARK